MKLAGKILIFITIGIFLLVLIQDVILPWRLKKILQTNVTQNCDTCSLTLGFTTTNLFTSEATIRNIHLSTGDPKSTFIDVKIKRLKERVDIADLFNSLLRIHLLKIRNLKVEVLEGDLKSKSSSKNDNSDFKFIVEGIEIENSSFSYTREHAGHYAPIRVTDIQATIGALGNTPDHDDHETLGHLTGILEQSGEIDLKVSAIVLSKTPFTDINLNLKNQKLEKMNPYFETNDGVILSGQLMQGKSILSIRNQKLRGYVQAKYKDLNLVYKKTAERSATAAFFSNLIRSMKINEKNTDTPKDEQIQYVELNRDPEETLLGFIFHGMKDAALKVATVSKDKKNPVLEGTGLKK